MTYSHTPPPPDAAEPHRDGPVPPRDTPAPAPATPPPGPVMTGSGGQAGALRPVDDETLPRRPRPGLGWAPLALGAALLLAGLLGWQWVAERTARGEAEATLTAERMLWARHDSMLAVTLAGDMRTARLGAAGQGGLRVFVSEERRQVVVQALGLPRLPAGRVYQLWGAPTTGRPRSLGFFTVDSRGEAQELFPFTPAPAIETVSLTEEGAGGVVAPTGTPRLSGPLTP